MGALFDDPPVHEDNDPVGIADCRQPVGDYEGCPSFHELIEGILDFDLSLGVEG